MMIKLKNLLKEATRKKYSYDELKALVNIWFDWVKTQPEDRWRRKPPTDAKVKDAIKQLASVGFLQGTEPVDALTHVFPDDMGNYKTTDGKTIYDLTKYSYTLGTHYRTRDSAPTKKGKFAFDYGNELFADPDAESTDTTGLNKFLKKWKYKNEPNTYDEDDFLNDLQAYTVGDDDGNIPTGNMLKVLKMLMPLKSKFPGILDPTKTELGSKLVYRGTTIPIDSIASLTSKKVKDGIEFNTPVNLKSKGTKGFLSFSTNDDAADNFATKGGDIGDDIKKLIKKGLVPAIISVSISDPKLIFNPDFVMNFSPTDFKLERETFYLGKDVTTKTILIPNSVIEIISDNIDSIESEYKSKYKKILKK